MRGRSIGLATALLFVLTAPLMACQAEQRPASGSVERIGTPFSGSVSGVSGSVSGVLPARTFATPTSIAAAPVSTSPTAGDGTYTPTSNVDGYLYFGVDFQDISALTNAVNEGIPLPSSDILAIYERGKNFRTASGDLRGLRAFARADARAREFPDAAAFYGSGTFLDTPLVQAIAGVGPASSYSPAQRRQVIQKGIQRILYYHTLQELLAAPPKIEAGNIEPIAGAPHNVDEAWAIYMGLPDGSSYPRSLSATARSREMNFNRDGAIDLPLREGLSRAQQAAAAGNLPAFQAAQRDVESRLAAIFYLGSARYLNEALRAAQSGNPAGAAASQAEGFSYYQAIQPLVAGADAAADQAVVSYYQADPATLTSARRDETLAALNRALPALGLTERDRVSPSDYQ
jgi:Low iron-inducible periplasmic protein